MFTQKYFRYSRQQQIKILWLESCLKIGCNLMYPSLSNHQKSISGKINYAEVTDEELISVSKGGDDFITVDNEISCDDNNLNVETEDDPNMSVLKICDDTPLQPSSSGIDIFRANNDKLISDSEGGDNAMTIVRSLMMMIIWTQKRNIIRIPLSPNLMHECNTNII